MVLLHQPTGRRCRPIDASHRPTRRSSSTTLRWRASPPISHQANLDARLDLDDLAARSDLVLYDLFAMGGCHQGVEGSGGHRRELNTMHIVHLR